MKIIPKIETCLRDIRCCDEDSATFECKIQGTPPPDIRWEKCGKVGISTSNRIDSTKITTSMSSFYCTSYVGSTYLKPVLSAK